MDYQNIYDLIVKCFYHITILVIVSNNILLSLPIANNYYLFLLNYISNVPNFIYLFVKN